MPIESTVHKVLRERLHLYAYKLQLLHHIKPDDPARRESLAIDIVDSIEAHPEYLSRVCFRDESTFHVSGKVNKHNCRIWGSENLHVSIEMERDSQKINVWCGLMKDKVVGPFFSLKKKLLQALHTWICCNNLQFHRLWIFLISFSAGWCTSSLVFGC